MEKQNRDVVALVDVKAHPRDLRRKRRGMHPKGFNYLACHGGWLAGGLEPHPYPPLLRTPFFPIEGISLIPINMSRSPSPTITLPTLSASQRLLHLRSDSLSTAEPLVLPIPAPISLSLCDPRFAPRARMKRALDIEQHRRIHLGHKSCCLRRLPP